MKFTKIFSALPLIMLALVLLLPSCAVNPVSGKKELMLISEAQEIQMGKDFYPSALWGDLGGGGEFKDAKLKAYLEGIIKRLHKVSHRPNLPVRFAIQNSSVPNAWAIPGYVVMTRGLLASLGSEAEFAFVMGHEMGHVAAKHSARQMTKQQLQGVGIAAAGIGLSLSGQDRKYTDAAMTVGAVGSSLLLLKYSRSDELEADRLGVEYMSKLGYDPENAIKAHQSLEKAANTYIESIGKSTSEGDFLQDLFSTHPRTEARIEEIRSQKAGAVIKGDGTHLKKFQDMTRGLRKRHKLYTEHYDKALTALSKKELNKAEKLILSGLKKSSQEPAFYALMGFIRLEKKSYSPARGRFNKALDKDPGYEPAIRGLGTYHYFKGNYTKAIERLEEAIKIFPGDVPAHFYMGMSYNKKLSHREAVRYLSAFVKARPKDKKAHYYLGESYEELRELGNAYSQYQAQVQVAPNTSEGRLAKRRLAYLKPILQRQQKERSQQYYR